MHICILNFDKQTSTTMNKEQVVTRVVIKDTLRTAYAKALQDYAVANAYLGIRVHLKDELEQLQQTKVEFHFRNVSRPMAQSRMIHFLVKWAEDFFKN